MDIQPEDTLIMKKKHVCGSDRMLVLRAGMDFRLRCLGCSHEFLIIRKKLEKSVRSIMRNGRSINPTEENKCTRS